MGRRKHSEYRWKDLTFAEQESLADQVAAMRGIDVAEARSILGRAGGEGHA